MDWLQSPVRHKGVQFLDNVSHPKTDEQKYASSFNFNQDTLSIKSFSSRYTADRSRARTNDVDTQEKDNNAISKISQEETVATLSVKVAGIERHFTEMKGMMTSMATWMKMSQTNNYNDGNVERTPSPSTETSPDTVSGGTPSKQQGLIHHQDDVASDVSARVTGDNNSVLQQETSHRQQAEE